jgi:hypothetical protein
VYVRSRNFEGPICFFRMMADTVPMAKPCLIDAECLQAVECLPIAKECPLLLSAQHFYSLSNACTLLEFREPNHKVNINLAPLQIRRLW